MREGSGGAADRRRHRHDPGPAEVSRNVRDVHPSWAHAYFPARLISQHRAILLDVPKAHVLLRVIIPPVEGSKFAVQCSHHRPAALAGPPTPCADAQVHVHERGRDAHDRGATREGRQGLQRRGRAHAPQQPARVRKWPGRRGCSRPVSGHMVLCCIGPWHASTKNTELCFNVRHTSGRRPLEPTSTMNA